MEQRVFNYDFLFVSIWLVVVDVFVQYVLSALTCLGLVNDDVFAICVRSPSSLLAGRHVVSAQFAVPASRRRHVVSAPYATGRCFFVRSAFACTLVSDCCLFASSLCRVKACFCLWFRVHACYRSCGRPTVPRCVLLAAPAVMLSTVINAVGVAGVSTRSFSLSPGRCRSGYSAVCLCLGVVCFILGVFLVPLHHSL